MKWLLAGDVRGRGQERVQSVSRPRRAGPAPRREHSPGTPFPGGGGKAAVAAGAGQGPGGARGRQGMPVLCDAGGSGEAGGGGVHLGSRGVGEWLRGGSATAYGQRGIRDAGRETCVVLREACCASEEFMKQEKEEEEQAERTQRQGRRSRRVLVDELSTKKQQTLSPDSGRPRA